MIAETLIRKAQCAERKGKETRLSAVFEEFALSHSNRIAGFMAQ